MKASWCRYRLDFNFVARTSRESLTHKYTYFIRVTDDHGRTGIGEAALFPGLSCDDRPGYERKLDEVCRGIDGFVRLRDWPSIQMGVESALLSLGGDGILFDSPWIRDARPLVINGLVWMGSREEMMRRMEEKVRAGFRCVKIKIGGIDFPSELEMLRELRAIAPRVELRLDANGAFSPSEALQRLDQLSRFDIHSIEQPVRQGNLTEMARICRQSPIRIALDEELIGLNDDDSRRRMLETVRPDYIILKPTLVGGFSACDEWIALADEVGAGWWATSALESNVGLGAIAQWVASRRPSIPQGLGTGQIYSNNTPPSTILRGDEMFYDTSRSTDSCLPF